MHSFKILEILLDLSILFIFPLFCLIQSKFQLVVWNYKPNDWNEPFSAYYEFYWEFRFFVCCLLAFNILALLILLSLAQRQIILHRYWSTFGMYTVYILLHKEQKSHIRRAIYRCVRWKCWIFSVILIR